MSEIHSCGYFCQIPACVLKQRDTLRDKLQTSESNGPVAAAHRAIEMIRAAGGVVHKDGNIFFTNVGMFNSACAALASHPATAVAVGPDAPLVKIHFATHLRRPFIYESVGRINLEEFDEIIAQAMKNQTEIFTKGYGDYTFKMTYFSGQYGPDGRCEYAPGWEFDFVAFAILTVPEGVKS